MRRELLKGRLVPRSVVGKVLFTSSSPQDIRIYALNGEVSCEPGALIG